MDEEEQRQDEQPAGGPVVTVPTLEGPVSAPAEAASHWDVRIWGRS
ncbi:hypothetical protein [Streptomyces glaucus]|uniref:Uncharacterized protein n=1 Tax=Streptomyces glaucus TaxID=284029 RepID=A0ABN3JWF3_9ACTN